MPVYLQSSFVERPRSVSNPLSSLKEWLNRGVVLPALPWRQEAR